MEIDENAIASRNESAVSILRDHNEEKWKRLAEKTALTKRQIAMWELSVVLDQKNIDIALEYDVSVTTVARHCERVRAKRDNATKKVAELREELQRWENTIEYFEEESTGGE